MTVDDAGCGLAEVVRMTVDVVRFSATDIAHPQKETRRHIKMAKK
jgi:hypothetical protein